MSFAEENGHDIEPPEWAKDNYIKNNNKFMENNLLEKIITINEPTNLNPEDNKPVNFKDENGDRYTLWKTNKQGISVAYEAFAAQTLATMKAWESEEFCRERLGRERALGSIDRSRLNIKGGSLAVGHPFAATGARIIGGLAKLIDSADGGRGLISICTAGGMGVTAILEK